MNAQVGIISDTPTYSRGLASVLTDAGFCVNTLPREFEPHSAAGVSAAVIVVTSTEHFRCIGRVARQVPVVSVLADPTDGERRRALRLGAYSALSWHSEPTTIVRAVHASLARESLLPYALTQSLLSNATERIDQPPLDLQEVQWLRRLAAGQSIAYIAAQAGYSEREMFRRLASVYRSMGVRNRSQAIAQAARWGLLDSYDDACSA